jgi:hypothetical protein
MAPDRVLVAQLAEQLVREAAAVEVVGGEVHAEDGRRGHRREPILAATVRRGPGEEG